MSEIVLASASEGRRRLLAGAGIDFRQVRADLDERSAEAPLVEAGFGAADIAVALAAAKAETVSAERPDDWIIGADQTLEFEGERWLKPADMAEARRQLLRLAGKAHTLHSALALAKGGTADWTHVESVHLIMRRFGPEYVGRYLARVGDTALASVGAYQIEGEGIQLFDSIDGDVFAIVGLPMLPLLKQLREQGAIDR
jgi:septum formation protein